MILPSRRTSNNVFARSARTVLGLASRVADQPRPNRLLSAAATRFARADDQTRGRPHHRASPPAQVGHAAAGHVAAGHAAASQVGDQRTGQELSSTQREARHLGHQSPTPSGDGNAHSGPAFKSFAERHVESHAQSASDLAWRAVGLVLDCVLLTLASPFFLVWFITRSLRRKMSSRENRLPPKT